MQQPPPLISVIITTYNQEHVIARALDSVIGQKCDYPFEIILGEDCSTDNTLRVCREYAGRYPSIIRLIANPVNKGILDNYFDCILAARGKYIADCAGDDFWIDPYKLQKQANLLEANPGVTLVHAGWNYYHDNDGSISEPRPKHGGAPRYRQPIANGRSLMVPFMRGDESPMPLIHLCTAMFRRDIFINAYNQDPDIFRNKHYPCEDVQLTMAMMEAGDIAFIPDKVLNYSVGHPSISSNEDFAKTFDFYYGVMQLKLALEKKYDIPRAQLLGGFRTICHYLLTQAFHCRSRRRRDDLIIMAREHNIPLTTKGHILRFLSSNPLTWHVANAILHR